MMRGNRWKLSLLGILILAGTVELSSRHTMTDTLSQSSISTSGMEDNLRDIGQIGTIAQQKIAEARQLIDRVKQGARYIESLTDESLTDLPLGIQKTIGNTTYTLIISAMRLKPEGAEIDLLLEIDLADQDNDPVFGASNVAFSRRGAIISDTRLAILADYSMDLRDQKARIVFAAATPLGRGTYVTIDCQGFKSLQIEGYAVFSRDWLLPAGETTGTTGNSGIDNRVHASFALQASSWDFIVQLDQIRPFSVAGVGDVHWTLEGITLDLSERENAAGFTFPAGYESPWGVGQQVSPLWRGVYARAVRVGMPARFSQQAVGGMQIQATDIIIDDRGFTGKVSAVNVLALEEGQIGSWAFAIDSLHVDITAMQLREARIRGLVQLPLLGGEESSPVVRREECIGYSAIMQTGGRYAFSLDVSDTYQAAVWRARVHLAPNSTIRIEYGQGEALQVRAELHGQLSVYDATGRGSQFEAEGIAFESLRLSTTAPYLQAGNWGVGGSVEAQLGKFGLHINAITLETAGSGRTAALSFNVRISLSEGMQAITAMGKLSLRGQLAAIGNHERWSYESLDVARIEIRASCSAWGLEGGMEYYEEDDEYGSGFSGLVSVWFAGLRPSGMGGGFMAAGRFGSKAGISGDRYRYYYVDVRASWADGLPLGTLKLEEIGGGISRRVSVQTLGGAGVRCVPDEQAGTRISAVVAVASPGGRQAMRIRGTFEIAITTAGGIDSIRITGEARMLGSRPTGGLGETGGGIEVRVEMLYDGEGLERGYSASAEVFMNLASGRLVGAVDHPMGWQYYAGGLEMMFGGGTWYVHVGRPEEPLGIEALFGEVRPKLAAYMAVGMELPLMPPVPVQLGVGNSGAWGRDEVLAGCGAGLVFGASLNVNTDRKRKNPFYYELGVGLGFDMMLQNYGTAVCANHDDESIGINGWYASGQAWAYLQGVVGITLNLPFAQGDFDIIHASLAAVLQIKGPNPFWAAANLRGMYRLLGGAAKGSFNIRVELGQSCILAEDASNPIASLQLIETTAPIDGSTACAVNQEIKAVTTLPFNIPQRIQEHTYKLIPIHAAIQKQTTGEVINVHIQYEADTLRLLPFAHLDGLSTYQFSIQVALLQQNEQGWFVDTVNIENRVIQFTTSEALDHIPIDNIHYAWPLPGQNSFYIAEFPEAYVQLLQAQPTVISGTLLAKFTSSSGEVHQQLVQIAPDGRRLSFMVPPLALQTGYQLEIIRLGEDSLENGRSQSGSGTLPQQSILTYYFRTSQFERFSQKVASMPVVNVDRFGHGLFSFAGEPFDQWELTASNFLTTQIEITTSLYDHPWFNSLGLNALLYASFPMPGFIENTWRDAAAGFPPSKAIHIASSPCLSYDLQQFIQPDSPCLGQDTLHFDIPLFIQMDYDGYKNQVVSSIEQWVQQEWMHIQGGDMDPEDLVHFDIDQNGQLTETDIRRAITEACSLPLSCQATFEGIRCPQFSGIIPCPLPTAIGQLVASQLNIMGSCRGQSFNLSLELTLPGMHTPNSVADLQVVYNQ